MFAKLASGPEIFTIDPARIGGEIIRQAAAILRSGGVVIYPTETFYALGAVPWNEKAVERIFEIKNRDAGKALPLIASELKAAVSSASQWPRPAGTLARLFWPGPLSLIVPASSSLPSALHAGTGKVAVRVSSHPVASLLAKACGGLIVSTSANVSGGPAVQSPDSLDSALLASVQAVVDGGNLPGGFPSTIVDVTVYPVALVREGKIDFEKISRALGVSPERFAPR
ncbi:MAG: L-threonylcarbamoyladenylate synthase [Syntrophobacteraceae bacterium]|nr:L-threonylcarbamoyladenylate synthase [Syntrophobacteraceae bacterium]